MTSISATTPPPPRPAPEAAEPARAAEVRPANKLAPLAEAAKPAAEAPAEKRPDMETMRREIKQALERLNQQVLKDGRNLKFAMDDASDRMVITVRESVSGEVIRQIPSEALLRVAHNLEELKGLLHDANS
jgi:flagellar protein FlaG